MWEPRSFDAYKNAAALMIVMLGCSELDTEISDAGMKLQSLMIAEGCPKKTVVSKDQRAGRIKQSDIKVQIHAITGGKNYGQVSNFGDGVV